MHPVFIMFIVTMGSFLFYLKHQVIALEDSYKKILQEIQKNQESLHVLKAEWAYLNDPRRLQTLANKYLKNFSPIQAQQIAPQNKIKEDITGAIKDHSSAKKHTKEKKPVSQTLQDLIKQSLPRRRP